MMFYLFSDLYFIYHLIFFPLRTFSATAPPRRWTLLFFAIVCVFFFRFFFCSVSSFYACALVGHQPGSIYLFLRFSHLYCVLPSSLPHTAFKQYAMTCRVFSCGALAAQSVRVRNFIWCATTDGTAAQSLLGACMCGARGASMVSLVNAYIKGRYEKMSVQQ